jgi:hypothetical protein
LAPIRSRPSDVSSFVILGLRAPFVPTWSVMSAGNG